MHTNDPGREPTDAERELVLDLYRAARLLAGNKTLADVQAVIDAVNEVPWSTMKRIAGARPMPDLIHEDELPEMTNAEYAAWYEKSFIPGGVGCRVGPRHMPDTPAPSTDDPVCGATTRVDGKFRTCELPNGHTSDHRTTLRGIEIWWPVDEPNAPDEVAQLRAEVARLRQGLWDCFAAAGGDTDGDATPAAVVSDLVSLTLDTVQGTRKDDEDEINRLTARIDDLEQEYERKLRQVIETWTIRCDAHRGATEAAEARIADLERENADLKRMVCAVQPSADHESLYCYDTVFRGVTMNWFDARDKMLSAGKEPTDAE